MRAVPPRVCQAVPVPSTDEPWIYDARPTPVASIAKAGTGVSFLAKSGGLSSAAGLRALARAAAELERPTPERWVAAAVQSRAHARQGGAWPCRLVEAHRWRGAVRRDGADPPGGFL